MPKIDISKAALRTTSGYPAPFQKAVMGRERIALGNLAGLTQFGVNFTRLKPGAASALRHWHEAEDEFVYVLEGDLTLIEEDGEKLLRAGEAAGFKAGAANGHHLVNKSNRDAIYLEIGTRAERERAHYPDDDLAYQKDGKNFAFTHKSGEPYTD
jgi:uncharacterized cupin superfamily protein